MEWYEQQSECCSTQLLLLMRIRDLAEKKTKVYNGTAKVIIFHIKGKIATFCTYFAFSLRMFPACDDFQYSYSVRSHILHGSHSVFGYPNNPVSERCPVPIDSDKRSSTVDTDCDAI
ncbi:uncharacterized protein TNCV_3060311 [Trichonephila clavipes]|uniref:Uncharacterized protein n=1 Tax=Trichonephila clavipes TaxID=2585209 RepID=A0A8X7BCJ4_TRICX|nr:uncharacterized protein TNCV_3060311 [Trichonephila clavipes]